MAYLFSPTDLLDIAIREEVTGATYYHALAERADSQELREFAARLARVEETHRDRFKEMLAELGGKGSEGESYEGEYESYLGYLLEGRIFPAGEKGEDLAAGQRSDAEAVETALALEKETLLLYHELMEFVPARYHKTLDAIVDEEREHLVDLTTYRKQHLES